MKSLNKEEKVLVSQMILELEVINSIPIENVMKWENEVPIYDDKVELFFRNLDEFWKDYNYVENIKYLDSQQIQNYDLEQLKTIITKLWRHERFCYGSWGESIKSSILKSIYLRLLQIINV